MEPIGPEGDVGSDPDEHGADRRAAPDAAPADRVAALREFV